MHPEKNQVKEIVKIVKDIYFTEFDESSTEIFDQLRDLSGKVWEQNHTELLNELAELKLDTLDTDFQLFWYDCLEHPRIIPRTYAKSGQPAPLISEGVPSEIHKSVDFHEWCGFHDLNINFIQIQENTVVLYLDSREWGVISDVECEVKLTFTGVSRVYLYDNEDEIPYTDGVLNGKQILSADELPVIPYMFRNFKMDMKDCDSKKRLFYFSGSMSDDSFYTLNILFDHWEYERYI